MGKKPAISKDEAERVAIEALGFLAEDPARLQRFMTETGLDVVTLRSAAEAPEVLASILGHLLEDESSLLVFAASRGIGPEMIAPLHHVLSTGEIPRLNLDAAWTRRR